MRTFMYQSTQAAGSTSGLHEVNQFWVLQFGLNTAPQIFTSLGHTVTGYLHRLGILVMPYLDDLLVHRQVLLRHQAQLLEMLDLVGFILNRKKSKLDFVQDIQFLGIRFAWTQGKPCSQSPKHGR